MVTSSMNLKGLPSSRRRSITMRTGTYHHKRRAHMAIKDIFLPLLGEPDAAAIAAIDKCVAVSGDLGARVTAMAFEEDIPVRPTVVISNDLDNTAAAKVVRSVSDARGLLRAFDAATIR